MIIAALDTETTGLPEDRDARAIEVAVAVFDSEVSLDEPIRVYQSLVNPDVLTEAGLAVALEVSGISEEEIRAAPRPDPVWLAVEETLDHGLIPVVGWNFAFDKLMVRRTFFLDEKADDGVAWEDDTMKTFGRAFAPVLGRGRGGEPRWVKLTRAAEMMGLSWDGDAHRALADAIMTVRIALRLRLGAFKLPGENPKGIHGKIRFSF